MSKACNIFKDGDRWCIVSDGNSAWSESFSYLTSLAEDGDYEVSYRRPRASVVLEHALCDELRGAALAHALAHYVDDVNALPEASALSWLVAWLVEHHPELARLALGHLDARPACPPLSAYPQSFVLVR